MKRKLPPLIPCPELRHLNKTMIIEVPNEFRKPGEPVFQIVSSFEDLENPTIKFKGNDILKSILENGADGKKLYSICVESPLQSTQLPHKKLYGELLNSKLLQDQQHDKTKLSPLKLSEKNSGTDNLVAPLAVHGDSSKTPSHFDLTNKKSLSENDYSSQGSETLKENQQDSSSLSITENNYQKASGETFQKLSSPAYRTSQGHENSSNSFQVPEDKYFRLSCRAFDSYDRDLFKDKGMRYPEVINSSNSRSANEMFSQSPWCANQDMSHGYESFTEMHANNLVTTQKMKDFDVRTTQGMNNLVPPQEVGNQDYRFLQQMEYQMSRSPQQTSHDFRQFSKRDSGLFQDYTFGLSQQNSDMLYSAFQQHDDFNQHAGHNHKVLDPENQNVKTSSVLFQAERMPYYDYVDTNIKNDQHPSWSRYRDSYEDTYRTSHSSSEQTVQNASCISNQNDKFPHQQRGNQRTLAQMPWSGDMRPQFSQSSARRNTARCIGHLPRHVFYKRLDLSEAKHIIFLDATSYSKFFFEFTKELPVETHIWTFIHSKLKLKFPYTQFNNRLISMKRLHIMHGDLNTNFPNLLKDLHDKLPLNVRFTIISNMQFNIVESILETQRIVKVVTPRNNNVGDIRQILYS